MDSPHGGEILSGIAALVVIVVVVVAIVRARPATAAAKRFSHTTIYDWQHGLLYEDGRFARLLPAGRYYNGFFMQGRRSFYAVPKPDQLLPVGPVEAVSADRLVLRLSASVTFSIVDVRTAFEQDHKQHITLAVQQALIALAAERSLETLLAERSKFAEALRALIPSPIKGCEIKAAIITALTLPPELRRLFSEVERAKLEGQAALERARGEQAALRSLANAARMLKGNPELMNLRILQTLSAPAGKSKPTLVIGQSALFPVREGEEPQE
ncbi:MAG: SPFH domain-containing protein [Hyphomicrobiales bacterium]